MERIEYRGTIDKSDWKSRGAWDNEPDKIQWQDEATGLPCLIVRGPHGSLCGYVGVPADHPAVKKDGEDLDLNVHGGITYGPSPCQEGASEGRGICHKPSAGEPDHVFWFGFDCAHAGDFSPKYDDPKWLGSPTGWGDFNTYRDVEYVEREVRGLARQLAALS